jgi:hypothetical protein
MILSLSTHYFQHLPPFFLGLLYKNVELSVSSGADVLCGHCIYSVSIPLTLKLLLSMSSERAKKY